jgi:hypothetical protein
MCAEMEKRFCFVFTSSEVKRTVNFLETCVWLRELYMNWNSYTPYKECYSKLCSFNGWNLIWTRGTESLSIYESLTLHLWYVIFLDYKRYAVIIVRTHIKRVHSIGLKSIWRILKKKFEVIFRGGGRFMGMKQMWISSRSFGNFNLKLSLFVIL